MVGYIIYENKEYTFEYENNIINIYTKDVTELYEAFFEETINKNDNLIYTLKGYQFQNLNAVEFIFLSGINVLLGKHKVDMKIEFYSREEVEYNKVKFTSNFIDAIYGTEHYIDSRKRNPDGSQEISLKSYNESDSKNYNFKLDNMEAQMQFQTQRIFDRKKNSILSKNTYITYKFSEKLNYRNLYKVINLTFNLLSFIIYNKNIKIKTIELFNEEESVGNVESYRDSLIEETPISKIKRYLKLEYIENSIEKLLIKLLENEIYLRNIPQNNKYIDGKEILMTTAGFEYVFEKVYEKVKHRDKTLNIRKDLTNRLEEIKEEVNDIKEKKMIDNLIEKGINKDDIKAKIIETNKRMNGIPNKILKELLNMNNREDDFNNVCEQIRVVRNYYAHGKLNINVQNENQNAIIGIIMLDRVIYLMQLKEIGIEDEEILKEVLIDVFNIRIS